MQEYTGQTKRETNKSSQSWGKLIPVGAYKQKLPTGLYHRTSRD